jgi:hypothetical protein
LESAAELKDWRIAVELVNYYRNSKISFDRLEQICLGVSDTSKTFAALIKFNHGNVKKQKQLIYKYLKWQPKASDCYLEAARFFLNPLYDCFSLQLAMQCLKQVQLLTPQNGDLYIEMIRAMLLQKQF